MKTLLTGMTAAAMMLPMGASVMATTVTINVDATGQIIVGGRIVELGDLLAMVSSELQRVGDDPAMLHIVIRADENSEARPVNQVVSALGRMQITRVRIAVQSEG